MAINGNQKTQLTEITVNAFNEPDLEQFLSGLDLSLQNLVPIPAGGLTFPNKVSSLIGILDARGQLIKFVEALIKSKDHAEKQEIRVNLPPLLTELVKQQVDAVRQGVNEVTGGMASDFVSGIVESSRGALEKLAGDIALLRIYKTLHDRLHDLQLKLEPLASAVRRLDTDEVAISELRALITGMQNLATDVTTAIDELPNEPAAVQNIERKWLNQFESLTKFAEQAADDGEAVAGGTALAGTSPSKTGQKCVMGLRGLLRREPARINGILVVKADGVNFSSLQKLFSEAATQPGAEQSVALRAAQLSTDQVQGIIKNLVQIHTLWQEVELNLWEAYDSFPASLTADASNFDAALALLLPTMDTLRTAEPSSPWAVEVEKHRTDMAACRDKGDWNGFRRNFDTFRLKAIRQFYKVDSSLKTLSGNVSAIGSSLQQLLNT